MVLDCLTLWLANLLLDGRQPDGVLRRVEDLVGALNSCPTHCVVVTNEVQLGNAVPPVLAVQPVPCR